MQYIQYVTVADCAGRSSRTRDLSLGRRVCYQFTKEVTSLARPVHALPAQHHSATFSPAKSVFVLEHQAQPAPSGFWPPRSCCTSWKVHTVRTLSFFHPSFLDRQPSLSSRSLFQPPCSHIWLQYLHLYKQCCPLATIIPLTVQTRPPSVGPISGAIVTVADCAGRPSRTRDLSLGRRVHQFTKEVTSLARPVHALPAQHHSATNIMHVLTLQPFEF